MGIVLFRLDERLIHGQVVVGWGSQLRPDRYLLVDDELAASAWEQELYAMGSGRAETFFLTVREARDLLPEWRASPVRSVVLVRDVKTLGRLGREGALRGESVNLGGLHHGPGRREFLTYLSLSDEDVATLAELEEQGTDLWAQDLPGAPKHSFRSLREA